MRYPRFYQATPLPLNSTIALTEDAFGHAIRVLRLQKGDHILLFNGEIKNGNGYDVLAEIVEVSKKSAQVLLKQQFTIANESPLHIHLGQGISRGDRMDYTLQKSVELGVSKITPLFTERCGVKLTGERLTKKVQQWQKIVISACEQSGRVLVPEVTNPVTLDDWLNEQTLALKLNLHPKASHSIMTLTCDMAAHENKTRLLIGPEGGLSDNEIENANKAGFIDVLLGPRVLRTETAALTAITALQCRFGDLN
jgi:16S rRNA (uracil1498-N3)-methyltransferase